MNQNCTLLWCHTVRILGNYCPRIWNLLQDCLNPLYQLPTHSCKPSAQIANYIKQSTYLICSHSKTGTECTHQHWSVHFSCECGNGLFQQWTASQLEMTNWCVSQPGLQRCIKLHRLHRVCLLIKGCIVSQSQQLTTPPPPPRWEGNTANNYKHM